MGFFDLFKTNQWETTISKIEEEITNSNQFRYFMDTHEKNKIETFYVKKYYSYILAIAIYIVRSDNSLNSKNNEISVNDFHNYFFYQTTNIREAFIETNKIKFSVFGNFRYINRLKSLSSFFVLQNEFKNEIEQSLISDEPYFFEEWDNPEYDEEFGVFTGQKNYFKFLKLILLTYLDEDEEGILRVKNKMDDWYLNNDEYEVLVDFLKFIRYLTTKN